MPRRQSVLYKSGRAKVAAGKKRQAGVRRSSNRRKHTVQRFVNPEVQSAEAALSFFFKALDPNGNARTERFNRSLRADLYPRPGIVIGALYHALQAELLRRKRVWRLHMEAKAASVRQNSGSYKPAHTSAVRRGLSEDAGVDFYGHFGSATERRSQVVPKARRGVYSLLGHPNGRCPECGKRWDETSADCERRGLHDLGKGILRPTRRKAGRFRGITGGT